MFKIVSSILTYFVEQRRYAWSQYYSEISSNIENSLISWNLAEEMRKHHENNNIRDDEMPKHIRDEFIEMATDLQKKYTCPICYEHVTKTNFMITHCGHIYCRECLVDLKMTEQPRCAMCRKPLKKNY